MFVWQVYTYVEQLNLKANFKTRGTYRNMTRILTFLLGFYVATIMKRWWAQITGLPKIADIAMVLNGLVMEGMMHIFMHFNSVWQEGCAF